MSEKDDARENGQGKWVSIIKATGSPLKLFALIVLICNSIFGIVAGIALSEDIFVYTLHTFLAVVSAFVLIALWSPRSFYSPSELIKLLKLDQESSAEKSLFPASRPLVPTLVIAGFILFYGFYQINK